MSGHREIQGSFPMAFLPVAWGVGLALAIGLMARLSGLDRDRAFYPTVLIVVASYYDLFAAMGGSGDELLAETLGFALFAAMALLGFRRWPWLVVAGLAGHGIFDAVHHQLIANPGVPAWWPAFCGAYDLAAAAFLAFIIRRPAAGRAA
jgi:hypothetical protein